MVASAKGKKQVGFFPSLLLLAIASNCVYYLNVINGAYDRCKWLLVLAISSLVAGYFFGSIIKPNSRMSSRKMQPQNNDGGSLDATTLNKIAVIFLCIGLIAHIYYYSKNPVQSYGESYGAGRGNGFITVFFNFLPIGFILNEYLASRGLLSKNAVYANRLGMLLFCALYFFCFMKRRQILFLLLAVMAVWGPKLRPCIKWFAYIAGILLIILFTIFGKVRGYFDVNGLMDTIGYVATNFQLDWISLDELEGKYISRTLNDVYGYVQAYGLDPSILVGVLFCMVPRALLGGAKPLAFPEWYTYHFYPADYIAGTGYAGSSIAEFYLIGGVVGVMLAYFVVGFVSARMQKRGRASGDAAGNIVYAVFIYTILLLPRYDLASLIIDIVFVYAPLIWAVRRAEAANLRSSLKAGISSASF